MREIFHVTTDDIDARHPAIGATTEDGRRLTPSLDDRPTRIPFSLPVDGSFQVMNAAMTNARNQGYSEGLNAAVFECEQIRVACSNECSSTSTITPAEAASRCKTAVEGLMKGKQ